jgi:adenosylcobinamide kinase/adenosylcobinamide-phosphate guanylyltransferase
LTETGARLTLITGPTRSGKSRYAERLAARYDGPVVYVATAAHDPGDAEWADRIAQHRARRPAHWTTIESATQGVDLATLVTNASPETVLLVESLGTWLATIVDEFVSGDDLDTVALERAMRERSRRLVAALDASAANVIVVSEQTGWGIVPAFPSARIFSSVLGRLTTTIARRASQSYLVVSGFVIDLHVSATLLDLEENL